MEIIFKQQKLSLRVLLSICLFFFQLQPGVAYKSVAYNKKSVYFQNKIEKYILQIHAGLVFLTKSFVSKFLLI